MSAGPGWHLGIFASQRPREGEHRGLIAPWEKFGLALGARLAERQNSRSDDAGFWIGQFAAALNGSTFGSKRSAEK